MTDVLRAASVYLFLTLVFWIAGKRSLRELTVFDFVLLLIISEATQQALVGDDFSIANAFVVIGTLVALDIGFSLLKQRFEKLEKVMDGLPLVLVENGQPIRERLDKERVDEEDILEAARMLRGLERMSDISYAVLERNGEISIVPRG